MAWDRRTLAALATCSLAYVSVVSCNGAEFSSGDSASDSGSGGDSSGAGNKATGGAGSGKGGAGGKTTAGSSSGGNVSSGGEPTPSGGTDPMGGSAGTGGQPPAVTIPKEGLLFWFAADMGVTEEGGFVAQWADQSGNGYHAVSPTAEQSPKLTDGGQLPLPFVEFDGVDDYLELPELERSWTDGLSLFVVGGVVDGSGCSAYIELSNGSEINDIHLGVHGNALQYEILDQVLLGLGNSIPDGEMRLAEAHHAAGPDQTPVEIRANGAQAGATVMVLPVSELRVSNFIGRTLYGGCSPYSGALAEILLYARRVPPDERADILKYLTAKWQCCG